MFINNITVHVSDAASSSSLLAYNILLLDLSLSQSTDFAKNGRLDYVATLFFNHLLRHTWDKLMFLIHRYTKNDVG